LNYRHLCLAALATLAVQGCATPSVPQIAGDELLDGQAKTCTASTTDMTAASPSGTITMTNDGWCGVYVTDGSKPYQLALIGTRPAHGRVYTQPVNGRTRIEYTPYDRYTGSDEFSVLLRPVGNGPERTLQVAVTVTAGAAPAVAEPAAKPATKASVRRAPAKRTTPAR